MSEPKTQITDVPPQDFIAGVEPQKKREEALVLLDMFERITGEKAQMWGPSIIGFGVYNTTYASGRDVTWMRSGFSPRKARHSLYLMGRYCDDATGKKVDALLEKMGKHKTGASCVYVNKLADIDLNVLEEIVGVCWDAMDRKYPE
ncbi:MAG: DUF1801 domain-containing protein [Erythrobacter sp.]